MTSCGSGLFPRWCVCPCYWVGVQNQPFSVFDGEWQERLSPGDTIQGFEIESFPVCSGQVYHGPSAMLLPSCSPVPGPLWSPPLPCCPDPEGLDSQDLLFSFWVEAAWCVLNDQPNLSSLAFSQLNCWEGRGSDL